MGEKPMAQIRLFEQMRKHSPLQSSGSSSAVSLGRGKDVRPPRHFGFMDAVIVLVGLAAVTFLIMAASRWGAPLTPAVKIQLSPLMLPVYAGYSLLRMLLAYLLSLIFTLAYGHIAATNRRAEIVMVPILDILQSVPILSFLPAVVLALVAAFPHSNIGLELASILLIFTSQAWNMTFSFYPEAVDTQTGKERPPKPPRPYQTLPHVSIGSVIGLVERVATRDGREDLYQLGRELQMEVDDLLPLVDTDEGDLVLTEAGKRFAEAGVLEEKLVFRKQALARIGMLGQIVADLEREPAHTVSEEVYLHQLQEHFSDDEAWAQLETLIDWGRYAELFSYVEDRGIFRLEEHKE
jgi:hypothetical protein